MSFLVTQGILLELSRMKPVEPSVSVNEDKKHRRYCKCRSRPSYASSGPSPLGVIREDDEALSRDEEVEESVPLTGVILEGLSDEK